MKPKTKRAHVRERRKPQGSQLRKQGMRWQKTLFWAVYQTLEELEEAFETRIMHNYPKNVQYSELVEFFENVDESRLETCKASHTDMVAINTRINNLKEQTAIDEIKNKRKK